MKIKGFAYFRDFVSFRQIAFRSFRYFRSFRRFRFVFQPPSVVFTVFRSSQ